MPPCLLETLLEQEGVVRMGAVGGSTKNRPHVAVLKRVLQRFEEVEVVEGRGREGVR